MAEKTSDTIDRRARDLHNKAMAALERNNLDYAIEMWMQCLAIEPSFTQGRKFLRAAQMKRTESAGGLKRMMAGARMQPLLTKARVALSKNPTEAMALAEEALGADPKNGQALQTLAEAAEKANCPETAAQTLEHYTKLNPRDAKALHWLARAYGVIGKHDLAREVYERLLQIDPADFDAQKGLNDATAHGAMQTGGWDEAQSYRDVMKDKEESVALEQQSRMVRAEDMIENLIKEALAKAAQEPTNPIHRRELGKLYGQKGDFETALKHLEELFAAEAGDDPSLEKEIAEVKTKRVQAQISAKKELLAGKLANAAALESEIAALDLEYHRILMADAERLVERYPNDLMYRYDLAVLYMKTGNQQGAIEQFQRSVGQPQRRVASLNYLGQCFQQMGLHDLAIDQYVKAIEELPVMDGLKKDLTYNLATAYEALGDAEKAVAEYKKIAAVDFAFRDVRERITRRPPPKPA